MKTQSLSITRAAMGISLQDAGRLGYLRIGMSAAGPMDWAHHAMVNRMLLKPATATAIEFGPAGLGLELDKGELQVAFAGPGFTLKLDQRRFIGAVRVLLKAGEKLEIIPGAGAMWGYLGFQGVLDLPPLLGSYSENSTNGLAVKKLQPGVTLAIKNAPLQTPAFQQFMDPLISDVNRPIGILASSQTDYFSEATQQALCKAAQTISNRFDRMAYRLQDCRLSSEKGYDILSDGVTMGAIQVPGDGRPFILMADHQPTGGYPKIACVCKADLPRLAQMSPGQPFQLAWQRLDVATQRWQDLRRQIESLTALKGALSGC